MAVRLVQNPQSRLQELIINGMYLEDHDFMAIVEALPTSRLGTLDVTLNSIQGQGILALAEQLPRIKCLEALLVGFLWKQNRSGMKSAVRLCCRACGKITLLSL